MDQKDLNLNQYQLDLAQAALASAGRSGLACLNDKRPINRESSTEFPDSLRSFYREQIIAWLNREMADFAPEVSAEGTRFTIIFSRHPRQEVEVPIGTLQLRFSVDFCGWVLLSRGRLSSAESPDKRRWWPYRSNKQSLSLNDRLCQVRRIVTLEANL